MNRDIGTAQSRHHAPTAFPTWLAAIVHHSGRDETPLAAIFTTVPAIGADAKQPLQAARRPTIQALCLSAEM
ncbi:hypothetical protein [Dickeya dadantii]|uniref:hypothetical protein n=1 Tax=Dickeya dadantii TaxID=204038 RepID=UPI0021D96A57|nr:hypothetical protein [Dickeya dadantii]